MCNVKLKKEVIMYLKFIRHPTLKGKLRKGSLYSVRFKPNLSKDLRMQVIGYRRLLQLNLFR